MRQGRGDGKGRDLEARVRLVRELLPAVKATSTLDAELLASLHVSTEKRLDFRSGVWTKSTDSHVGADFHSEVSDRLKHEP